MHGSGLCRNQRRHRWRSNPAAIEPTEPAGGRLARIRHPPDRAGRPLSGAGPSLAYAALWRERLPDARLVVVDECGHLPHVEHAAIVARHVREYLEGVAP